MNNELLTAEQVKRIQDAISFCGSEEIISVTVNTDQEYLGAGDIVKALKQLDKDLEADFRLVKDPIVKQGKAIDEEYRIPRQRIDERIRIINRSIVAYQQQKEIERRKDQEERDRLARLEQQKLLDEAEDRRKKAEASRDAGRDTTAEKHDIKADILEQQAAAIQAPISTIAPPKLSGVTIRKTWKGKVVDKASFLQWAIVNGNLHFVDVNESALNAQAKACKGEMKIPGVEWYEEVGK